MKKQSRRNFFRTAGLGAISLAGMHASGYALNNRSYQTASAGKIEIGVATYSMRKLSLEQVIEGMKTMQLKKLNIKSMHLPMEASDDEIKATISKLKNAGLEPYGCGVVYMKSEDEVDNAFRYANAAGFKVMVSVPNYDLLDYVEEKAKQNDILIAIHNHGPDGLPYPSVEEVMKRIKTRDKKIGMCFDVAHEARSGLDPVKAIEQHGDRIYDLHLRDIDKAAKEGGAVRPGRGVMDIPGIMKALKDTGYQGVYSIEYEVEAENPVPGILETAGYLRGIGDAIG